MGLSEEQARWDRLRSDPEFERGWLRTMGSRPSAASTREWGDGVGRKNRPHVIADLSYADDFVLCICGWSGTAVGGVEWDGHIGGGQREVARTHEAERFDGATDEEVAEFLARLSGEHMPQDSTSMTSDILPNEGDAHRDCTHGKRGTCLVGYAALSIVLFDPHFPFERVYPEGEFA